MNGNGYVQVRRGLLEHIEQGRLSSFDVGIYIRILLQADHRSGIWFGSAEKLLALGPKDSSRRRIQISLRHLESIGFIRRYRTPGKRGNYPVLINKFLVTDGKLKGQRLNADRSNNWRHPDYDEWTEIGIDSNTVTITDGRAEAAPIQEQRIEKREVKEQNNNAAASKKFEGWTWIGLDAPIGTIKFQRTFDFYYSSRNGNGPSEVMEQTIQRCQNKGLKVPPPFFEAKRRVEERERLRREHQTDPRMLTARDVFPKER